MGAQIHFSVRSLFLSLGISLGLITLLLVFFSPDPLKALWAFFLGPFSHTLYWGNILSTAGLLCLGALGVTIAFRAGTFNLGGEGQIYLGALGAVVLGLSGWVQSDGWGLFVLLGTGAAVGGLMAGLSGYLKEKTGADPLITTFLLSAAALPVVDYFVTSPGLRDPESVFNEVTRSLDQGFWLSRLLPPSKLHWGVLLAIPLILLLAFVLFRTRWGYVWRVGGQSPSFIRSMGLGSLSVAVVPLGISGAFHGLAGAVAVLGQHHALVQGFSFGLGWNAITAALIARNHPLWILPSAVFLSYLDQAGQLAGILGQFPFSLGSLIPGIILLLITAQSFLHKKGGSS